MRRTLTTIALTLAVVLLGALVVDYLRLRATITEIRLYLTEPVTRDDKGQLLTRAQVLAAVAAGATAPPTPVPSK